MRELRQARRWTQVELAKKLDLSQSRLSEIENGDGSFSAEQFLELLRLFNVTASSFDDKPVRNTNLQNALARHGASHLVEDDSLPSEELEEVHTLVLEALLDGSSRFVTALAPVLLHAKRLNLPELYSRLEKFGLGRRLNWLLSNVRTALDALESSPVWSAERKRLALLIDLFLSLYNPPVDGDDLLDRTIRTEKTFEKVKRSGSDISRRWRVVTTLRPEDFVQAFGAADAADDRLLS